MSLFVGGGGVGKPGERGGIFHVDVDGKVALNGLQRSWELGSH
jgi:hypothetical protein